ncbi:hypothetical protein DID74_01455 [Candidatus Marinamargulisbacteria bacterium SCGC AG-333-B06]|nr:hypothetical protein DID74_01455 [Candidatus Marinamargulisbacteria bacterium SCGC AG-333-B06]
MDRERVRRIDTSTGFKEIPKNIKGIIPASVYQVVNEVNKNHDIKGFFKAILTNRDVKGEVWLYGSVVFGKDVMQKGGDVDCLVLGLNDSSIPHLENSKEVHLGAFIKKIKPIESQEGVQFDINIFLRDKKEYSYKTLGRTMRESAVIKLEYDCHRNDVGVGGVFSAQPYDGSKEYDIFNHEIMESKGMLDNRESNKRNNYELIKRLREILIRQDVSELKKMVFIDSELPALFQRVKDEIKATFEDSEAKQLKEVVIQMLSEIVCDIENKEIDSKVLSKVDSLKDNCINTWNKKKIDQYIKKVEEVSLVDINELILDELNLPEGFKKIACDIQETVKQIAIETHGKSQELKELKQALINMLVNLKDASVRSGMKEDEEAMLRGWKASVLTWVDNEIKRQKRESIIEIKMMISIVFGDEDMQLAFLGLNKNHRLEDQLNAKEYDLADLENIKHDVGKKMVILNKENEESQFQLGIAMLKTNPSAEIMGKLRDKMNVFRKMLDDDVLEDRGCLEPLAVMDWFKKHKEFARVSLIQELKQFHLGALSKERIGVFFKTYGCAKQVSHSMSQLLSYDYAKATLEEDIAIKKRKDKDKQNNEKAVLECKLLPEQMDISMSGDSYASGITTAEEISMDASTGERDLSGFDIVVRANEKGFVNLEEGFGSLEYDIGREGALQFNNLLETKIKQFNNFLGDCYTKELTRNLVHDIQVKSKKICEELLMVYKLYHFIFSDFSDLISFNGKQFVCHYQTKNPHLKKKIEDTILWDDRFNIRMMDIKQALEGIKVEKEEMEYHEKLRVEKKNNKREDDARIKPSKDHSVSKSKQLCDKEGGRLEKMEIFKEYKQEYVESVSIVKERKKESVRFKESDLKIKYEENLFKESYYGRYVYEGMLQSRMSIVGKAMTVLGLSYYKHCYLNNGGNDKGADYLAAVAYFVIGRNVLNQIFNIIKEASVLKLIDVIGLDLMNKKGEEKSVRLSRPDKDKAETLVAVIRMLAARGLNMDEKLTTLKKDDFEKGVYKAYFFESKTSERRVSGEYRQVLFKKIDMLKKVVLER